MNGSVVDDDVAVAADLEARLARERGFWNAQQAGEGRDPDLYRVRASDRTDRSVAWLPALGFPAYVTCVLDTLTRGANSLAGLRILDLGTGSGFLATLLAANGAEVDAVDVSEASLAVARWRASISGVESRMRFHVMPAERLGFPDGSFDAIAGAFVLHHLALGVACPELRRVLRPGGTGAFIETSGNNLILMTARRVLTGRFGIERASSVDEAPLGPRAMKTMALSFPGAVDCLYPSTLIFRMLGYVPGLHRPAAQRVLSRIDGLLHRVPSLRRQSYYCVVAVAG